MSEAFFQPLGAGRFRATEHTAGPWDPAAQHGGPPSALLARQLELCEPRPGWLLARTTVEILGPVPVGELTVRASLTRPGRSVELVDAELFAADRPVARARGWRIRQDDSVAVEATVEPAPSKPGDAATQELLGPDGQPGGYLGTHEWRFTDGSFTEPGPATVWARPRVPLLADEPTSPVQRVLLLADCGNGISARLNPQRWYFINPELSVHLYRPPGSEWLCLQARTAIGPAGVGLAESRIFDERGAIGRGAQSLLVAPRS